MNWIPNFHYDFGVSFFFVLSGFILCYAYRDFEGAASVRDFYVARIARIWPLHIFMLCAFLLSMPKSAWFFGWTDSYHIAILLSNILLVHAWIPVVAFFFGMNAVSWSISTEAFFYLIFPVLRHRWEQTWHWKSLIIGLLAFGILAATTVHGVPSIDVQKPLAASDQGIGYISPFVRIIEFAMGMLAANVYSAAKKRKLSESIAVWTVLEIVSISLVVLINQIDKHNPDPSPWTYFLVDSPAAPAFMLVVVIFAFGKGLISKSVSVRPLVVLGEASFALYLSHLLLYRIFDDHRAFFTAPDAVLCIGYWATAIAVSMLLWRFVETPARDWIRNRGRRETITTSAAV